MAVCMTFTGQTAMDICKLRLRRQGELDALAGRPIESFFKIPDIDHTEEERKQYEMAYRGTDAELRREGH